MTTKHYSVKSVDYFSNVRRDVVSLIPDNRGQKILEIGAGTGNTLHYIKETGIAAEVMGVELMKLPGSNQESPLIDRFQIANIEQDEIKAPPEYFDVILCADVLEHLVDPWATIDKIAGYLKKDGVLIVSMPNIREWKTLAKVIFKGEFTYYPEGGIMDRTHLRFFCKKNIRDLLTTPSLSPIFGKPNFMLREVPEGKKRRLLNLLTFRLFEDFMAVQYLFIAKKR
ncbi:MAG TPA: methyltransferase domain-containing protein [Puia sp.]|jgi:2-polyprenyl-3-methyl-5-hydroxy-6-metoxy-1,4-benzoquinol methylase|nr:methyltransferase domain-containing protein [Puia sp.]